MILRDICEAIDYGYTASASSMAVGPRFLRITDIVPDHLDWGEVPFCEITPDKLAKYRLQTGDIVIARTGATTGWAKRIKNPPEAVFASYLVRIRLRDSADSEFVGQIVQSQVYKDFIQQHMGGAAQPNASAQVLTSFPLELPSLPIQRRIASILSAYDDLIENNLRRIKILEEMARALYREWFVDLRFPEHEMSSRVASVAGVVPRGWQVMKIGDAFKTVLGGTPSRARPEFWNNGTIAWINSGKANDLRVIEPSEMITTEALEKSAAKLMPVGTTILAITGATLGQVSYLEIGTAANQSVVGIVDESGALSEWLYLTISDRIESIIMHASGGAQQHINKEVVNDVVLALPPKEIAEKFQAIVKPIFRQIATQLFRVQNLRRTRDLLLPRLLSGDVPVSEGASLTA